MTELDKLDRLAAEKVMGWKYLAEIDSYLRDYNPEGTGGVIEYGGPYSEKNIWWQPTRNIAQAWECLDKLNPFAFHLQRTSNGYSCTLCMKFGVDFLSEPPLGTSEYHQTAPLTIVRACLKAKGVEI